MVVANEQLVIELADGRTGTNVLATCHYFVPSIFNHYSKFTAL